MVVIQAGSILRVTIPVKNTGLGNGNFSLTGKIFYKDGAETGNLVATAGGSLNPVLPIIAGETKNFVMEKANWAGGVPTSFDDGQQFDVIWEVTVQETGIKVSATDLSAVQHSRGYVVPPKPAAPTLVETVAVSSTSATMKIAWANVVANPPLTKWRVYRAGAMIAELPASTLTYSMTGLVPGMSYNFYVSAGNDLGYTASNSVNFQAAQWLPPIGNVVPDVITAHTYFRPSIVYPGDEFEAEIGVKNIGEGSGDIRVEVSLYLAGTSTYVGRLRDAANDSQLFTIQNVGQGMEIPVFMYNRNFGNNLPDSFADGQKFDAVVTLTAVVGSAQDTARFNGILTWLRGTVIVNPPATAPTITATVSGNTATVNWNGPADCDYCQLTDIGGGWFNVPKSGSYQYGSTNYPLVAGTYTVQCRGVNTGGTGPAKSVSFTIQPSSSGSVPPRPGLVGGTVDSQWAEWVWYVPNNGAPAGTAYFSLSDGQSQTRSYVVGSAYTIRFTGLNPSTTYTLTVYACNTYGCGPSSSWTLTTNPAV